MSRKCKDISEQFWEVMSVPKLRFQVLFCVAVTGSGLAGYWLGFLPVWVVLAVGFYFAFTIQGVMRTVVIRSSSKQWFPELMAMYKSRKTCILVDDAKLGLNPSTDSLETMAVHARLTRRELLGLLMSTGVGTVGVGMVVSTVKVIEPTIATALLLSGSVLTLFGYGHSIYILTKLRPSRVEASLSGFSIIW